MPAYFDKRRDKWIYRKMITLTDGTKKRIFGAPPLNTKRSAEEAERLHALRLLRPEAMGVTPTREVPVTFDEFAKTFLEIKAATRKPSSVDELRSVVRVHLAKPFGKLMLDEIDYASIEDYATEKAMTLSPKTVNNHLAVIRSLLGAAVKRGKLRAVPEIPWLTAPKPEIDFLTFEEADRLVAAADGEWRAMMLVALRCGLRQGELLALRWEDVDLVAGQLRVVQAVTRGRVGTPKGGRSRGIPLGDEVLAAIKAQRHLRGELVFCTVDGRMFTSDECKRPIIRACQRAGLRRIGWHTLRHTFASHLVMRGVPLKAVQELLGHAAIEMTMRYAHLSPDVKREAVRALDRGTIVAPGGKTTSK